MDQLDFIVSTAHLHKYWQSPGSWDVVSHDTHHWFRYLQWVSRWVWSTLILSTHTESSSPPNMSLASLAASSALPHEFLFIIDIISGVWLERESEWVVQYFFTTHFPSSFKFNRPSWRQDCSPIDTYDDSLPHPLNSCMVSPLSTCPPFSSVLAD